MRPWLTTLFALLLTVPLLTLGCPTDPDDDDDDDTGDDDTGDDDTGDDDGGDDDGGDDDTGDDDGGDDDTAQNTGMFGYYGEAIADADGWDGWEELYLIADEGDGKDVCRIRYDVADTGPRNDCDYQKQPCNWAHDVVFSNPQVLTDVGGACAAIGYDKTAIAALDGATRAQGFILMMGHAQMFAVRLQDPKSKEWAWELACYGQYNDPEEPKSLWPNPKEGEGYFMHDWEIGLQSY